jgi:hypothetical protein
MGTILAEFGLAESVGCSGLMFCIWFEWNAVFEDPTILKMVDWGLSTRQGIGDNIGKLRSDVGLPLGKAVRLRFGFLLVPFAVWGQQFLGISNEQWCVAGGEPCTSGKLRGSDGMHVFSFVGR